MNRLQPALLDRLSGGGEGGAPAATIDRATLRRCLLRDLGWLLNAVQPMARDEAKAHPRAAASTLNYGLPPFAGESASRVDVARLERAIADAIRRFEPRIVPDTLKVRALRPADPLATHNVLAFEIEAVAWAQPAPIEMLLHTRLDLEGCQVEVREVARGTPGGAC